MQGSQFVWIPVGKFIKDNGEESNEIILGRYTFTNDAQGTPTLQQAAYTDEQPENYKEEKVIANYYNEYSGTHREGIASSGLDGINATAYNLEEWVGSVKTNGGYYIGRYEASYASGTQIENYKAATKVSKGFRTEEDGSMEYTQGTLWNYITQLEASKVAINTYKESNYVKSDLINSYAWDTAIVYIQECGHINYANKKAIDINNELTNTGTKQDEVCKINDMASNMAELSTEYSSNSNDTTAYHCSNRGGFYYSDTACTARRYSGTSIYSDWGLGFRLCLYLEHVN